MAAVGDGAPRMLTDAEFASLQTEPLTHGSLTVIEAGVFEGQRVVVKRFPHNAALVQQATQETAVKLHRCRHSNVTKLVGFYNATPNNCVLVLERLEPVRFASRTRSELLLVLAGAAEGVAHMHRTGVVHGEIKGSSFFVRSGAEQGSIAAGVVGGISGVPAAVPAANETELSLRDPLLPPGAPPTPESDVYSFGVAALTMICRKTVLAVSAQNDIQALIDAGDNVIAPLLRRMIAAADRPTMAGVAGRFQALVARGGTAAPVPSWKETLAALSDAHDAATAARTTQRLIENTLTFDASALAHGAAVAGFRAGLVSVVLGDHAENATVAQLARMCKDSLTAFELVTGGAPLITDLSPLATCTALTKLNVEGCRVPEASLAPVVDNTPNLAVLCVSNCAGVGNTFISVVGNASCAAQSLRELYCKGCTKITDVTPLGNCAGLTKLVLNGTGVTDASLAGALPQWTGLQLLSVSGCGDVGDASVAALARMPRAPQTLRELYCRETTKMSSPAFAALSALRGITKLTIAGMRFNDADIQTVVRAIAALETLDISNCALLCDGTIGAVVGHCATLRQLWCNGCVGITAAGIPHLARCTMLDTLGIGSVPTVTDATLAPVLAIIAPKLTFLNISGTAVTKTTLLSLQDAKKLRDLICVGCVQITAADVTQLQSHVFGLKVVHH